MLPTTGCPRSPFAITNIYSTAVLSDWSAQGLFVHLKAWARSGFLCCKDECDRWVDGGREEDSNNRDRLFPEAVRLNSISLWKICSMRQMKDLKKFSSLYSCGACTVRWLCCHVGVFVFIMQNGSVIYSSLNLFCLPLTDAYMQISVCWSWRFKWKRLRLNWSSRAF